MASKAHGAVIGFLKGRVAHIGRISPLSHPARPVAMVLLKPTNFAFKPAPRYSRTMLWRTDQPRWAVFRLGGKRAERTPFTVTARNSEEAIEREAANWRRP